MVKVLNVAEKPSVAKEVSRILSNGRAQRRQSACVPCPSPGVTASGASASLHTAVHMPILAHIEKGPPSIKHRSAAVAAAALL